MDKWNRIIIIIIYLYRNNMISVVVDSSHEMFTKIKMLMFSYMQRENYYNMEIIQKLQEEIDLGIVFIIKYFKKLE